jgi:hypothetical protein
MPIQPLFQMVSLSLSFRSDVKRETADVKREMVSEV